MLERVWNIIGFWGPSLLSLWLFKKRKFDGVRIPWIIVFLPVILQIVCIVGLIWAGLLI